MVSNRGRIQRVAGGVEEEFVFVVFAPGTIFTLCECERAHGNGRCVKLRFSHAGDAANLDPMAFDAPRLKIHLSSHAWRGRCQDVRFSSYQPVPGQRMRAGREILLSDIHIKLCVIGHIVLHQHQHRLRHRVRPDRRVLVLKMAEVRERVEHVIENRARQAPFSVECGRRGIFLAAQINRPIETSVQPRQRP